MNLQLLISNEVLRFEVDTGSHDNFLSYEYWIKIGKPHYISSDSEYVSASQHKIPILGMCTIKVSTIDTNVRKSVEIPFTITKVRNLNLLGLDGIGKLNISLDTLYSQSISKIPSKLQTKSVFKTDSFFAPDISFHNACKKVCQEFPELWKSELGCLKDFELDVKLKSDAKPIFLKPRQVPFALREELSLAIENGIAKGVWEIVPFNKYGTPVVPVRKSTGKIRVCGDYSITVNPQLEKHRHLIPLPEDLIQKLSGGYGSLRWI